MKRQLTKEEISAKVERIFPDKNGKCVLADEFFLINFSQSGMIAIEGRHAFVKWPFAKHLEKMQEYKIYCEQWNLIFVKKQFLGMEFIPLIWDKKRAEEDLKIQHDQFLECVGIVKAQKAETDLMRLQKLAGKDYVNFYKLIQEVKVIGAHIEERTTKSLKIQFEALVVKHENGRFSFPINNIVPNDEAANEQIKNIFLNLLKLPVASWVSIAA